MSSYRPGERGAETYRTLPNPAGSSRNLHYDDRPRRSSPSPRRRSSPHEDHHRTSGRGPPANDSQGHRREWDDRRDRDRAYDRDRDYRERSLSSRRTSRGRYQDWDREDHQQHRHRDDSRGSSRSGRRSRSPLHRSQPSRDIIMEGLPPDLSSHDVSEQLKKGYHVDELKDVRVIKDRQTGESRQFGYLNFGTIAAAKAFVDENHPYIYLYGSGSGSRTGRDQATKVHISFCRERGERDRPGPPDDDWTCHVCSFANYARRSECRKCQALHIDPTVEYNPPVVVHINTGDSDVSPDGTPSQFLLFRGLEATVTMQLLAKGAAKLYKSSGNSPPPPAASKKSGPKISSTTAGSSFGAKIGSIRRVLLVKDRRTDDSWRYGFVEFAGVEDSQAALAKYNSLDKFTISSKPVMVSFIHAGVFVPVLDEQTEARFTFSPLHNSSMKLAYWDDQGYLSELVLANVDDQPLANDNLSKSVATSVEKNLIKPIKEGDAKNKKRKADVATSSTNKKTVPAHLNFWRNRHAELHGLPTESEAVSSETAKEAKTMPKNRGDEDNSPPTQSYADMNRKCCLLCARQFKTEAEVNKHERLSQLHRDNLRNEEMKIKAHARLAKAGIDVPDAPAYRDRAKERRVMFNQPRRPAPDSTGAKPANSPPKEEPKEEPPVQSKGAALLGKMGWTAGEGLGAQGTGITAPVATDMYVQGVGLGAQGGKVGDAVDEAQRNTTGGYGQFLERAKDKAKERFQRMN